MNLKYLIYFFFFGLLLFSSCRKDNITTDIIEVPPEPDRNIESTINGFVTDSDGEPVGEVNVSILNSFTQTNELGFFEISGLNNERNAVIRFEKVGYFDQIETLIPSKNTISRTRIQLIEKSAPQSISASVGGQVTIGQNATVQFTPDSFVDEQGNTYSGNVNVYSFFIDPTDSEVGQIMPGNLMARNTENEMRLLESYGMVNVILEGDGGQKLNIDKAATLSIDVPNSILNSAPSQIPLWYFDEDKGLWMEEGIATLQNGTYTGEVEHFTFWNCDVPNAFTQITGQVFDNKGIALLEIRITDQTTGASFSQWTDSEGGFDGFVPQDVSLLFEILDACGEVVFSSNIGPFSSELEDLGTFNISSNTSFSLITGTLVNCDLEPISNGEVVFNIPTHSFYQQTTANASGEFSALIPTCDLAEIELFGIDVNNALVSDAQVVQVSPNIDAGTIIVCNSINPNLGSVVMNIPGFGVKTFDNCTLDIQNGGTGYVFVYYEDVGGGDTIYYYLSLTESNGDINNPNFSSMFFGFGPPNPITTTFTQFTLVNGQTNINYTVDQVGATPGEILGITMDNVRISYREKSPAGSGQLTSVDDSSMSITAVIIP